jgi:hypothetical protein
MSLEIAEMLQYTKSELINNDFNEIMIPKAIQNYHSIYMKQFTLSGLSSYKASTFLVNKSLQLIPVDVKCIVLPTKNTLYTLFIKVQKSKSNVYIQSHLLLDMSYQLWAMSESFENNFLFSLDMLKMIKFNFCDFFDFCAAKASLKIPNGGLWVRLKRLFYGKNYFVKFFGIRFLEQKVFKM